MTMNRVEIDGRHYLACRECGKTLKRGYDSPRATEPGEKYHPVLCGPDYRAAFAEVYPDESVPEVEDGFLGQ